MAADRPEIVRTVAELRERVGGWRTQSLSVGLVPTMGALHDGHLALVRQCRADCDRTVVSIFVNPTQFAPHEDFDTYPRDADADLAAIGELGTELAFMPSADEMYGDGFATTVTVDRVSRGLCGAARPHFFQGVATVVAKLLLQCLPDRAYFGEKDYQQLIVVRRMARDLNIPAAIVGVPTVREPDGLALSSRNAYLSAEERKAAPVLHDVMQTVAAKIVDGEAVAAATGWGLQQLAQAGFDPIDYLEARDAETLAAVDAAPPTRPARLLAAAHLGKTRLIDNIPLMPPV
ncbi:MAG: pantoate--beta-alanine ligase [Alphaproteobacteria bacterium]|nr:pantoate--beta-alanine ligase [Alphaproteobacteria bacterium]